jgi:hypothetical protein
MLPSRPTVRLFLTLALGAGALVFGLIAAFATPVTIANIAGIEITNTGAATAIAALLGFQALAVGFTVSATPICFG